MHILLDENLLSKKLKMPLIESGHLVKNVDDMGWHGVKDSFLLMYLSQQIKTYPISKIFKDYGYE